MTMAVDQSILASLRATALGGPGGEPRWTSSAKCGVGCALSPTSPLWFTLGFGIVNEVYYPRLDAACIRDLGFLVTSDNYFAEEKRDCSFAIEMAEPGTPAFLLENSCRDGRWRMAKRIVSDSLRPCLLQEVTFAAADKDASPFKLYALLAPHLVNAGSENSAWIADYKQHTVLFASGHGTSLALACSDPWFEVSADFVGASDGWQKLQARGSVMPGYARADNGNVALTGGVMPGSAPITFALGFGNSPEAAADVALASLDAGFASAWNQTIENWREWQAGLRSLDSGAANDGACYRTSTAVLATHFAPQVEGGAAIASLSIPWGQSKGDNDLGGYHLVWPRDMCETATGFLAAGDHEAALSILAYLREVQLADGGWAQNMWLDGKPYWNGVQLDECGFPLLLTEHLHRLGYLSSQDLAAFMPMVRRASAFLLWNGPVTGEDRWEEDSGYSPFTLAVIIAALLAAADLFDLTGEPRWAVHLRQTADCWNDQIENWTFARTNDPNSGSSVEGHYIRIAAPDAPDRASPTDGTIAIRNRVGPESVSGEAQVISSDALALVRFGLRAPDDPHIVATIKAIDSQTLASLPQGSAWYRYNGDGYGEHADGAPFDGDGIGRLWPLLTGERAHYELAAGRTDVARELLVNLEQCAGQGGMLPEQVWDSDDIPSRLLWRGRPTGSAMPLVWAHSEHIKLIRSIADGAVFDQPPQGLARYVEAKTRSALRLWRYDNRITTIPAGQVLRIEVKDAAMVHWGVNGWIDTRDADLEQSAFSTFFVDLPVSDHHIGTSIDFTLFWHHTGHWEGTDFHVQVEGCPINA